MSPSAYLRYEVLRTFRNRRFFFFSLAFPLVLFLVVAGTNRNARLGGVPFPLYYMIGMVAWGSMVAIVSSGGRIAAERQLGWTRQLRVTPLGTGAYFSAKVVSGYLMAGLTIAALYVAGSAFGVRLSAAAWCEMTATVLVDLVPFAVLGILLGHLLVPDSLGPALGGITGLFALLGGAWGPIASHGGLLSVAKAIPSYWIVQAGRDALGASGWPPAEAWIVVGAWTAVLARLAVLAYRRDTARV